MRGFGYLKECAVLKKLCDAGVFLLLFSLLVGLPLVAFSRSPEVTNVIKSVVLTSPPQTGGEITLDHLAALTSFYQTVIGILVTVIGLLATLSFLTIRHLSKTAAEDMAVEAAKRVISDSNSFREDVAVIVDESVGDALSEVASLKSGIESLTKALAGMDKRISDLGNADGGEVVVDAQRGDG